MPLQVVFSVYQKPPGEIERFSIGDDLFNICGTQQTLVATIYGDINGHTFEWEQILDNPAQQVTWLIPDYPAPAILVEIEPNHYESSIFYEFLGADKKDKKFRFWIDKGTPFQRYDEIIVYATPSSITFYALTTPAKSFSPLKVDFVARRLRSIVTGLSAYPTYNPDASGSQIDIVATNYSIMWAPPETEYEKYLSVTLQLHNPATGMWEDVVTHPINNRGFNNLLPNRTYRLAFLITDDMANQQNRYVYYSDNISTQQLRHDDIAPCVASTVFSLGSGFNQHISIPSWNIINPTVKSYLVPEEDLIGSTVVTGTDKYVRIPTYVVVDLGGGSIGG